MPISVASILPYPWIIISLSALLAFIITWLAIPRIVYTARINNLFVQTNTRTSHKSNVPNLGGIAVFSGFVVSTILLGGSYFSFDLKYIICALIIILFIGIKDDLTFSNPWKKLFGQILAIAITAMFADIRINNFYGFFGIYELSHIASIIFTIFVFLVIINGFNLIDGIDGLASGIGITTATIFGIWFWLTGDISYAVLSLSLSAALAAFFYFNVFSRTFKLFLGDTGSLVIGFVLGILTCRFLQIDIGTTGITYINSAPAVAFGILIIPLFDTLRVFTIRTWKGKSPFIADRQHIHHRLIDLGMSHLQATLVLVFTNLTFVLLSFLLQGLGVLNLGLIILVSASLLSLALSTAARRKINIAEQPDLTFEGTWNRQIITKSVNKQSVKEKDQPVDTQFPIQGPEESEEPERIRVPQPLPEKKLLPTNKEIHADLD
jgi:UDP-N-acetylmuramyl pentapeptide phosphotransferase/UDP-N-acetylglucosamine-1-phosphate transferase